MRVSVTRAFTSLFCAPGIAVYGTVAGALDHEKIQGAIIADSQALLSTTTNKDGYYLLGLNSGSRRITISAAGFIPSQVTVSAYAPVELHVELQPLDYNEDDTSSNVHHALFDYRSAHISPGISQSAPASEPASAAPPDVLSPVRSVSFNGTVS